MPGPAQDGLPVAASPAAALIPAMTRICGAAGVVHDPSQLATYECDGLTSHRTAPALVVLPELPLNANGKVDRAKLPAPASGPILAPANRAEQALADIWRRVLGVPEVSRDANFFDLGGTSLQLIEVHAEIQRALAPNVNLMDLFRDPSIVALAARISQVTPIRSPNDNRPLIPPAAAAQRASLGAEALRRIREARGR